MFASIDVVGHYLQREARSWVETILREEDSAYSFRFLIMADLESNELFEPIDVTINCSIIPPCRNYELYSSVYVVYRVE